MSDVTDKILEFLNEISIETGKHISGEDIVQNIGLDKFTFKKTVQLLEDKKFVNLIRVTGSLPMIKITSNGRQFLRGEQPNKNTIHNLKKNQEKLIISCIKGIIKNNPKD